MIVGPRHVDRPRTGRSRRRRRGVVALLGATLALQGTGTAALAATPPVAAGAQRDVVANLWEWSWPSVANECTTVLGPNGYGAVQVAPPADSLSRLAPTDDAPVRHPWWEVYQPVRYDLTSRMGNEAQFKAMVATCRRAGVKVYVDAVINHMTGQGKVSYGGVAYAKYRYAGLYGPANFHTRPRDCPSATGGIENFNDPRQVVKCELVGLSDLRTETPYVRSRVVGYLNKLIGYGVSGFRVDAAKHVGQADLIAIRNQLRRTVDGERPFFALEVFPGGPGDLTPLAFTRAGTALGFDFAYQVKNAFKSYTDPGVGAISALRVFGEDAGLLPSDKTLVFIQNHDTERGTDTLSYKDGRTNLIANQFMLAYGYGRPQVYSGFQFDKGYDSPPSTAAGFVTRTNCALRWKCVDRDHGVANMVGFHNHVGSAPVTRWFDDGANLIAFSRGTKGWIAINNATTATRRTFRTAVAPGRYCDIIHGDYRRGACTGPTIVVRSGGAVTVTVAAKDAVAFDTAHPLR